MHSPYSFAFNDPLRFDDPTGLAPEKEKGGERLLSNCGLCAKIQQQWEHILFAMSNRFNQFNAEFENEDAASLASFVWGWEEGPLARALASLIDIDALMSCKIGPAWATGGRLGSAGGSGGLLLGAIKSPSLLNIGKYGATIVLTPVTTTAEVKSLRESLINRNK